ncbi:MAG: glutamate formimidoyltransferase [Deltaproteobacteria bacterium]|nr:glutamate formimidoyltransferase [Deltaproteobacteria bacterium]
MQLVECVPNVSEGQNKNKIRMLRDAIMNSPGISLLHVDSNCDANRTVFTFAGNMQDVSDAAFALFTRVRALVNMRVQHGEHVRNGALDVCPFIPISDIQTTECIRAAHALAERIGRLGVPVYLYGMAATSPSRHSLSAIRKGQYEGLRTKISQPAWYPDYGPSEWTEAAAQSGSVQIGVRPFLIAFNINLNTQNVDIAKTIARTIRESGFRGTPGEFKCVKADGWRMAAYDCAQVTMNFTDFSTTPVHMVFDRVRILARQLNTDVAGSELIGLIPLDAIRAAGSHYANGTAGLDDTELIRLAIDNLGLNAISPFIPNERIFEYRLKAVQK